jgi:hypothetical protein
MFDLGVHDYDRPLPRTAPLTFRRLILQMSAKTMTEFAVTETLLVVFTDDTSMIRMNKWSLLNQIKYLVVIIADT